MLHSGGAGGWREGGVMVALGAESNPPNVMGYRSPQLAFTLPSFSRVGGPGLATRSALSRPGAFGHYARDTIYPHITWRGVVRRCVALCGVV